MMNPRWESIPKAGSLLEYLAMEAGVEKGKMEMILELLRENQPLSLISKVSKYSVDKIAEIGKMNGLVVTK